MCLTVCTNCWTNGQIKGGWQQEKDFQFLSDGASLESEMSPVSMAANKIMVCSHMRPTRTET